MAAPAPATVVAKTPSASLYVGDLLPEVSEGVLFELFNSVGPVSSIRVCRDTHTRRSLGYAYVNFHSVVDAERALDTLNNQLIANKPCRIMWSQRDPTVRKTGVGNVFIKNLDPKITHKELHDTFSQFGSILSCKVAMTETGASKGYGFVHFESQKSAEQAMAMVNDMQLVSKKVFVGPFIPRKSRSQQLESSWTNVFVKDIDPSVTEAEFESLFTPFGKVTSFRPPVAVNKEDAPNGTDVTKFTTLYGFVNFEQHEDAAKAVKELHGKEVAGKALFCCRAQKKDERRMKLKKEWEQSKMVKYQGINLYIKNIEDDIDEERLKKEFSPFGTILSVKIMLDPETNASKGFGFVCFNTQDESLRAISDMNGRVLSGCTKPLYVALHEPRELRRAKLASRHLANLNVNKSYRGPGGAVPPGMYPPGPSVFYPGNVPQGYLLQPRYGVPQAYQQPIPGQYMIRGGRGGGRGGNANRGARQPAGGNPRGRQQQPDPVVPDFSLATLAQYPFEQQKLFLGERLYPLIAQTQANLAGKITGMFLDSGWSIEELFSLLTEEQKLHEKIEDALAVLANAQVEQEAEGQKPETA